MIAFFAGVFVGGVLGVLAMAFFAGMVFHVKRDWCKMK